jgi:glycosyltransferase involved in cell wall biosynthesis
LIGNTFAFISYFSFSVIFFFYLAYYVVLLHFNRKQSARPVNTKDAEGFTPYVSVVIPIHNEETVIVKKVQNIEEIDYPSDRIEVIFVDGQSTDRTPELILEKIKECKKSFKLIRQEKRDGYTNALIRGILESQGEIILAMDAASYYYPETLNQLIRHFTDPKIGSVTGKEIVLSNSTKSGFQMEKSYRHFYDFMRRAETEMDSTPDSKGEILAVRREICINLIPHLKRSSNASFDSCVPYKAKMMGYRSIYDELARYYEFSPASFNERTIVQTRRATLLIAPMFLFKSMILNKKFGNFGLVIMPVHFIMDCILPTVFWFGCVSLVVASVLNPFAVLPIWVLTAVTMLASARSRFTLGSFIQSQIALFTALFRLAGRRKTLLIESVQSTRS